MGGIAEREILKSCKSRLELWQLNKVVIHFDRHNSGKINVNGRWIQMAKSGTPDLIAYIKYKDMCYIYFIECKRPEGGLISGHQIEFLKKFKDLNNVIYEIVTSPKQIDITIEKLTGHYTEVLKGIDFGG